MRLHTEAHTIDQLFLDWLKEHQEYALVIVPVIAFLEACVGIGIFVSGVILLSVCTVMYTEQIATLPQMLPLAFLGETLADHSGYYLGLWLGPRFHHTKFAQKRRKFLDKSEAMIRRFGPYAIIFGLFDDRYSLAGTTFDRGKRLAKMEKHPIRPHRLRYLDDRLRATDCRN